MPGFLLHVGAEMKCLHQALAVIAPSQLRVLVGGKPVATMTSKIKVVACPFTVPGPKPQPCLTVKWSMPTTRVLIGGKPALVQAGPGPGAGVGMSGVIPNGPPVVGLFQSRVFAT